MNTTTTKIPIKDSPASVCVLDTELKFINHSDVWLEEFHVNVPSLIGQNFFDIYPNTPKKIENIYSDALKGNASFNKGQKFIRPDGRIQWLKWKVKPWKTDEGEIGGLIVVIEDITEEKRSEELLRKAKQVARIGGWEVDLIANTVYWTDVTKEIHEVPMDYIPNLEEGINFYKAGHDREKISALVSDGISEGKPWDTELRIITATGREVWVRAKGETEIVNGKCVRLYGTFQDIDDKKRVELKFQEITDRLAIATKAANVGVWEYNVVDNVLVWDDNMYRLYGIRKEDFSGVYEAWTTAVHPEDQEEGKKRIEMAIAGEKEFDTEFRVVWPNGQIRYIRAFAITQRDEKGQALKMIGTNWDITEIRHTEKRLKNLLDVTSEQNKSLMNFAHIVSHNLRSHSSNLSMLTGFLSKEDREKEKVKLVQMLDEASESLNETVQHLNEVVQVKTGASEKIKAVNLHNAFETVQKNLALLIKEKKTKCIIDIPATLEIKAIPAYLDSILLNLFTNSLKYSSPKRPLKITAKTRKDHSHVWLSFEDNGLGIDLDRYGDKIFGMYKTFHRHKDAKGIGLFITKNQVEAMNGKISVESEVNKGTTFHLCFELSNGKII